MKICSKCGAMQADDTKFCPQCGAELDVTELTGRKRLIFGAVSVGTSFLALAMMFVCCFTPLFAVKSFHIERFSPFYLIVDLFHYLKNTNFFESATLIVCMLAVLTAVVFTIIFAIRGCIKAVRFLTGGSFLGIERDVLRAFTPWMIALMMLRSAAAWLFRNTSYERYPISFSGTVIAMLVLTAVSFAANLVCKKMAEPKQSSSPSAVRECGFALLLIVFLALVMMLLSGGVLGVGEYFSFGVVSNLPQTFAVPNSDPTGAVFLVLFFMTIAILSAFCVNKAVQFLFGTKKFRFMGYSVPIVLCLVGMFLDALFDPHMSLQSKKIQSDFIVCLILTIAFFVLSIVLPRINAERIRKVGNSELYPLERAALFEKISRIVNGFALSFMFALGLGGGLFVIGTQNCNLFGQLHWLIERGGPLHGFLFCILLANLIVNIVFFSIGMSRMKRRNSEGLLSCVTVSFASWVVTAVCVSSYLGNHGFAWGMTAVLVLIPLILIVNLALHIPCNRERYASKESRKKLTLSVLFFAASCTILGLLGGTLIVNPFYSEGNLPISVNGSGGWGFLGLLPLCDFRVNAAWAFLAFLCGLGMAVVATIILQRSIVGFFRPQTTSGRGWHLALFILLIVLGLFLWIFVGTFNLNERFSPRISEGLVAMVFVVIFDFVLSLISGKARDLGTSDFSQETKMEEKSNEIQN